MSDGFGSKLPKDRDCCVLVVRGWASSGPEGPEHREQPNGRRAWARPPYSGRRQAPAQRDRQVGNLPYALRARSFAALRMTEWAAGMGMPALQGQEQAPALRTAERERPAGHRRMPRPTCGCRARGRVQLGGGGTPSPFRCLPLPVRRAWECAPYRGRLRRPRRLETCATKKVGDYRAFVVGGWAGSGPEGPEYREQPNGRRAWARPPYSGRRQAPALRTAER